MSLTLDVSPDDLLSLLSEVEEGPLPLAYRSKATVYLAVKGVLDFCLAALLLVVSIPVILVCAVLVKLTSRGPAFYSQVRLGLRGRPYRIYKLRTMNHLCEAESGPRWSKAGDPRITRLGRVLRRIHLDELPQLWNILRGEMSLVGPRPERPEFIPPLAKAVALYPMRLLVRPGVTGLAQVQAPADTDLGSVRTKIAYDLYYIHQASLWMDMRILVATLFKVGHASFAFLRKAFLLPSREAVEAHYQALRQAGLSPQQQAPAATRPAE
jgi:lipopolysaccharide/colanic/teichoic acid biosynthesis glycosyltransferase